jgi:hypothetical protein
MLDSDGADGHDAARIRDSGNAVFGDAAAEVEGRGGDRALIARTQ